MVSCLGMLDYEGVNNHKDINMRKFETDDNDKHKKNQRIIEILGEIPYHNNKIKQDMVVYGDKDFRFIETEYESAQKVMTKLLEQKNKAAEKIIALKKKTMSLSEQDEEYQNIEASIKYEENLIEKYSSQIKQYDSWMKELKEKYEELCKKSGDKLDETNKELMDEFRTKEKIRRKKSYRYFLYSIMIVCVICFLTICFSSFSVEEYILLAIQGFLGITFTHHLLCVANNLETIDYYDRTGYYVISCCLVLIMSIGLTAHEEYNSFIIIMEVINFIILMLGYVITPFEGRTYWYTIGEVKANKFENYTNKLIQKSKEISHNKGLLYYKKKKSELINKIEELNTNSIELNDAIEEIDKKISNADLNDIKGFKSEKQNIVSNIMDNTNSIIDRKKWLSYYNTQYLELLEKTKGLVKSEV